MSGPLDTDALLAPLKQKYIENLKEKKGKLESVLNNLQKNQFSAEEREELSLMCHSLAGSGATYGFNEISEQGSAIEHFLEDNPSAEPDAVKSHVIKLLDIFSEIIIQHEGKAAAEMHGDDSLESSEQRAALPRVLIADDDEMIRVILKECLKGIARITECASINEALKIMKLEKPDLVLLDDQMPGDQRGIELLEKIQGLPKIASIPVILISANHDSQAVMRSLMAGAVDYIIKPIKPDQVIERVKKRLKTGQKSILIADDDPTIRNMLRHKLLNSGCRILTAEEGTDALEVIKEQKPNLVILDRMMPGMDGITVLSHIQKDPATKDIPVIFLTAKQKEEEVLDGLNLGAVDYIVKPFNPAFVITRCMRILNAQGDTK